MEAHCWEARGGGSDLSAGRRGEVLPSIVLHTVTLWIAFRQPFRFCPVSICQYLCDAARRLWPPRGEFGRFATRTFALPCGVFPLQRNIMLQQNLGS
jgi:hypothetical protein